MIMCRSTGNFGLRRRSWSSFVISDGVSRISFKDSGIQLLYTSVCQKLSLKIALCWAFDKVFQTFSIFFILQCSLIAFRRVYVDWCEHFHSVFNNLLGMIDDTSFCSSNSDVKSLLIICARFVRRYMPPPCPSQSGSGVCWWRKALRRWPQTSAVHCSSLQQRWLAWNRSIISSFFKSLTLFVHFLTNRIDKVQLWFLKLSTAMFYISTRSIMLIF